MSLADRESSSHLTHGNQGKGRCVDVPPFVSVDHIDGFMWLRDREMGKHCPVVRRDSHVCADVTDIETILPGNDEVECITSLMGRCFHMWLGLRSPG